MGFRKFVLTQYKQKTDRVKKLKMQKQPHPQEIQESDQEPDSYR